MQIYLVLLLGFTIASVDMYNKIEKKVEERKEQKVKKSERKAA